VALARGGACETVEHGVSGWLVEPGDGDAVGDASRFAEAMGQIENLPLSPEELHARACAFSIDHFDAGVTHLVTEALERPHAW